MTSYASGQGSDYYAAMVMAASNYDTSSRGGAMLMSGYGSSGLGGISSSSSTPHHPGAFAQPVKMHQPYALQSTTTTNSSNHSMLHGNGFPSVTVGATAGTFSHSPSNFANSTSSPAPYGASAPPSLKPSALSSATTTTTTNTSTTAVKCYRHNPYGASEPSTPTTSHNTTTLSANSSFNLSGDQLSASFQSAYASSPTLYSGGMGDGSQMMEGTNGLMYSVSDQFYGTVGSIAPSACTVRGRHLLISVLRLMHPDKTQAIFEEILPQVNVVALDAQGCHVLRTLIEAISEEQAATLASYLEESTIVTLATASQHTRRALQTLFERHRHSGFDFIVQVIAADATRLAMTQQGCIAIMRIIENSLPHQKHHLVAGLIPSLPTLTMDPYGNYVVQCILQNFDANLTVSVVCDAFMGHWVPLSCNKFASNVMEKVVRMMTGSARAALVRELVFEPSNLLCLMQDGFGNFVLQAIIDSSVDATEFRNISETVRPQLHTSPYGHKIDSKLKSKRFSQRSGSNHCDSGYSSGSNN
mmetsp:Transcript_56127/g.64405  ORF Transcript_56127/g.64405 Transcript_56127/m.64405 type:complete len:529 (+) Transcript_56127:77-1663(+)|eukprot:CAMPEP_0176442756 /NCGR_PEP_ID=MMETSP0127-20121128/22013_1 /TAXON_ID=938130 /ORGANISM="Platyophrya macrostoma, Strain WH" /LENGTH=528 /DNA_ID=CAMNT_0017827847 /DNA_START=77 /DNA_END=1663 /DNA_ORIENTATION=-